MKNRKPVVKQKAYDIQGDPDELMDKHWTAARMAMSIATLNRELADSGSKLPKPIKLGGKWLWTRRSINDYIEQLAQNVA